MKSLSVRLAVLTIALSGFAASTVVSRAASRNVQVKPVVIGCTSPTPMCLPSNPKPCLGQQQGN